MKRMRTHLAATLSAAITVGGLLAVSTPANALVACDPHTGACWHVRHRYLERPWIVYHAEGWRFDGPRWRWRDDGRRFRHRHHRWRRY